MVLNLPDIESFIAEAKEAGAVKVYVVRNIEYRRGNGVPIYRAWFAATAVGTVACHAAGPEKALFRYERDFGPVLQDLRTQSVPQDYRERVEKFVDESPRQASQRRLRGAGRRGDGGVGGGRGDTPALWQFPTRTLKAC